MSSGRALALLSSSHLNVLELVPDTLQPKLDKASWDDYKKQRFTIILELYYNSVPSSSI
jgi:hypothetical protein